VESVRSVSVCVCCGRSIYTSSFVVAVNGNDSSSWAVGTERNGTECLHGNVTAARSPISTQCRSSFAVSLPALTLCISVSASLTGLAQAIDHSLSGLVLCWYDQLTGAVVGSSTLHSQAASVGRTDAKRYFYSVPRLAGPGFWTFPPTFIYIPVLVYARHLWGGGFPPKTYNPPQTACRSCALNLFSRSGQ